MKQFKWITGFWLVTMLLVGTTLSGFGQRIVFRYADSATYQLYTDQSWDSLIEIGKTAIKNNIDYYYLRIRMAEAYDAKEQYILSARSYEKALKFNQSDPYAGAGLYDAYLNSGKKRRANYLSRQFNESMKKKLGIKFRIVDVADFFGGYIFSNNAAKNGDLNLLNSGTEYGEQVLFGDEKYVHAGLMFSLSPSFSLYAGGSFIDIAKTNRYQHHILKTDKLLPTEGPGGWINYRYAARPEVVETSIETHIKQYELYLNGKLQFDKGWSVNLYTNLLFINAPIVQQIWTVESITDTLHYQPTSGEVVWTTFSHEQLDLIEKDSSFVNWVAGFELQKDMGIFKLGVSGTYSEISFGQQGQIGFSCFYYPLGSTKLYGQTALTGFFESNEYSGDDQRLIFHQMIGVKLFKKSWLEVEYMSGNLNNINLKQASVIYNLPEKINFIAGLNLHIFATEKLQISLIYNYSDKNGFYTNQHINNNKINEYSFDYQTQSIIGGLKWTF